MAFTFIADRNWSADQKKKMQQLLNRYGFTDANGNRLSEDGIIGPKTNEAIEKMNRYQQELETPSGDTRQLQKQINDLGYTDQGGKPLKEDGILGPKTDAANNKFENSFLDGLSGGKNQVKTVQKTEFQKAPKLTEDIIRKLVTPQNKENDILNKSLFQGSVINSDLDKLYRKLQETEKYPDYSKLPESTRKVLQSISTLVKSNAKPNNLETLESGKNEKNILKSQNMLYNNTNTNKNSNIIPLSAYKTKASVTVADINALKDRIIEEDSVDLSDPRNNDAVRVAQKLVGIKEDGVWSPELMNRLQDYLANESDQFDTQSYKITEKNLETLKKIYWSGYYNKKENAQKDAAAKTKDEKNKQNLLKQKQGIIDNGAVDLSNPDNKDTVKAVQKAIGMLEDGIWSPQVLNGLKDYLISQGDQFDENSLTLSDKNLDTIFGIGSNSEHTQSNEIKEKPQTVIKVADINDLEKRLNKEGIDLSDPQNSNEVRVVQKLFGMKEDGVWSPQLMNQLQNYLASESDQFNSQNNILTDDNLKNLKKTYWNEYYIRKNEREENERNLIEFEDVKQRFKNEGKIDVSAPENRGIRKVLQRIFGMDDTGEMSDKLLNQIQNYLIPNQDFDTMNYMMTENNFDALLEAMEEVEQNPHIDKYAAKGIDVGMDIATGGGALSFFELLSYLISLIGKKPNN